METVARLVPPAVVPGWITEGVGDYTRMFHGAFDFASPDATYNRCDDIARLLYRHFLGQAPTTVHVEIIELKQYHGERPTGHAHPAWAKEYRAAGEGQIDLQHKAVALTSVAWDDGTDDLVVDLAGAQFGNWPTYCPVGSALQVFGRVAFLDVTAAGCSDCKARELSLPDAVSTFCRRRDSICKGCGGTGKFLVDARYRSRADAPWGVQLETPHWKEWVKRYATPEFRASGFEVSLRPWPGEDMMITFDGKVVAIARSGVSL